MSATHWEPEDLSKAKEVFAHRRVARFQDVDAAGIVFFPRILEYFHDAYVELLTRQGAPLEQALRERLWAAPIGDAHARFLKPIRFGDALSVYVVALALQSSDLHLGYCVRTEPGGAAVAVGETHHVFVDPQTFRRAEPPELVRRALTGLGTG